MSDEFFDQVGTEAEEWKCPGPAKCHWIRPYGDPWYANIVDEILDETDPNFVIGHVRKCRKCGVSYIHPTKHEWKERLNPLWTNIVPRD